MALAGNLRSLHPNSRWGRGVWGVLSLTFTHGIWPFVSGETVPLCHTFSPNNFELIEDLARFSGCCGHSTQHLVSHRHFPQHGPPKSSMNCLPPWTGSSERWRTKSL